MSYMRLLWAIMDNFYPILAHEFEESGTNLKIVRTNLKIVQTNPELVPELIRNYFYFL